MRIERKEIRSRPQAEAGKEGGKREGEKSGGLERAYPNVYEY